MVLPGAHTSSEQCLRHTFEYLPSTGKAERIFHVPQSAKTRRRIRSARSESVAPKQSRCPSCRRLWGRLLPINTDLYTCTHTSMHTRTHTHTHIHAHTPICTPHTHLHAHLYTHPHEHTHGTQLF